MDLFGRIGSEMTRTGYKFKTVSISHLPEIRNTILNLVNQGRLDRQLFNRYLSYLESKNSFPEAKTLIIIAMPQSITRFFFNWQGIRYQADIPPTYFSQSDDAGALDALQRNLGDAGYQIKRARLPVKTLVARSGLSRYGKNNLTYIPGLGSFYRLIAFYTDWPYSQDSWQPPEAMKSCEKCSLCLQNCPTGSISHDRFLIRAEICLTYHNESEEDFPDWIKPDWHNSLVGCMRCQMVCPVNKNVLSKVEVGPEFCEAETGIILNKTSIDNLPADTRKKLDKLIFDDIYSVMARNLRVLIENQDRL